MSIQMGKRWITCAFVVLVVAGSCVPTVAAPPTAPQLFPENTLAYFRVADAKELKTKIGQTSLGKLGQDPEVAPLVTQLYSGVLGLLSEAEAALGVNIEDLLELPQGEVALALVAGQPEPGVVIMMEYGDQLPVMEILEARFEGAMRQQGRSPTVSRVGGLELVSIDGNVAYFMDQGRFVAGVSWLVRQLAERWEGQAKDYVPLSENRRFTTIMSQSAGAAGERPQVSFFIDPWALAKQATQGSTGATFVMALLPPLGIDGIQGVGGSLIWAPKDFDSILHLHLLLANPRRGVLSVVKPKRGEVEPQGWVHEDVGTYLTVNWDFKQTLGAVEEIYDTFRGPDAFREQAIGAADRFLGINFQQDVIDQLDDRFTFVQVFLKPARINSGVSLYAFELKQPRRFVQYTLPAMFEAFQRQDNRWTSSVIEDVVVYHLTVAQTVPANLRQPTFAMAVVGQTLVFSDGLEGIEQAIQADRGRLAPLSEALEYQMVRDRIAAQLANRPSSIMSYSRPQEALRALYDLAIDPENQGRLRQAAEANPQLQVLVEAVAADKLPSFEVISKYLAPSGGFVIDDETGIHYTVFSLRR
jgi:hypothetical protein